MSFIIARRLNSLNDLDYLTAWDEKHGTACMIGRKRAMQFDTEAEALEARKRCRKAVPVWHGTNKLIEYLVLEA